MAIVAVAPAPMSDSELSADELARYQRQLIVPAIGRAGQERLKAGRVLLVGAGGLGSPVALYLAAAGVGTLGILDDDRVDITNLQRQILYDAAGAGRRKVDAAAERLAALNAHVRIEPYVARLTSRNALEILRGYDVVVDGTDNFATRYLVNDACVLLGIPNVYGSVFRFDGQASVFATPDGPCYRCLFPVPPPPELAPNCADAGVLGVLPGLVGTIQAAEAIKLLLGAGDTLAGRLLLVDALRMRFRTIAIDRAASCPACGTREITSLIDYDAFCAGTTPLDVEHLSPAELARLLQNDKSITLIDVREPHETAAGHIDGARLIPLGALAAATAELDRATDYVVYCQSGARSATGARQLRAAGLRARSLAGGITAWRKRG